MIQDFFKKVSFDYSKLLLYFLSFINTGKLVLSMDRTEWDFGKTQINILCVFISIGKFGLPLYFEMLDNNSGNSSMKNRQDLFEKILKVMDVKQIKRLIMDREFIGHEWLRYLKKQGIEFCLRVPKSHNLLFPDGSKHKAIDLLGNRKSRLLHNVVVDGVSVNVSLSIDKNGELLFLIGQSCPQKLRKIYKKRWNIENYFQSLKDRGFNMEKSKLRCLKKYKKLFAIVSIAYALCWKTGIEKSKQKPEKVKKHGYPQYSVFRRGLNEWRYFFKVNQSNAVNNTLDAIINHIAFIT